MTIAHTISSPATYSTGPNSPKRLADYEPLAKICSAFVLELFAPTAHPDCADTPYDSLPYFIAMAFSKSQLPETNALSALTLLQRLKCRHPTRTFSSPPKSDEAERLFLSSYIAATKVLSDDRYRLQFWVQVCQNKFKVEDVTQMEKDFFEDLAWDVRIDDATLAIFQLLVERRKQVEEAKGRGDSKPRSGSLESQSSSTSSDSTSSSGSSWSSSHSESSPTSTVPNTPFDYSISDPVIAAGMLRVRQSEQNIRTIDQHIEELQSKFDALMSQSPCQNQDTSIKAQSTRHKIKERILHVFH